MMYQIWRDDIYFLRRVHNSYDLSIFGNSMWSRPPKHNKFAESLEHLLAESSSNVSLHSLRTWRACSAYAVKLLHWKKLVFEFKGHKTNEPCPDICKVVILFGQRPRRGTMPCRTQGDALYKSLHMSINFPRPQSASRRLYLASGRP